MEDDDSIETRRLVARLRFRHLHLLVTLREGGSLRAAAGVLNLTQPALSKALAEVEGAFGFALFVRSARGLVPTPRGEVAIRGAALLLRELAHVGAEASADPAVTLLRIGAPPFVAQGTLPAAFVMLMAGESPVRVQLMEERVPMLVQALVEGRLDALVTSYPAEMPEAAGQQLRYEKIFDAEFAVIAPPGHPLARARKVDWQQLATARWIMPARISMVRRVMDEAFRRAGVVPPQPAIESTSPFTNLRLVAAGLGLSAVPESTLRIARSSGESMASSEVARVRVHPPIPAGPVALVWRDVPHENPRVRLLRHALGLR